MQKIVYLFLFLVCFIAKSQDVILTQAGDSIKCKIEDETPVAFLFSQQNKKGKVIRSQIFKTMVRGFKYNYKSDTQSGGGDNVVKFSIEDDDAVGRKSYKNYMRYQLGLQVGNFYTKQMISNTILSYDYLQKLKNGSVLGIEGDYFLNDHVGLGIQYLNYRSLNQSSDGVFQTFDGKNTQGKLSDKQVLNLLALQGHYRYYLNYKMIATGSFAAGYGFYRNQIVRGAEKGKFQANGFFSRPSLSFDYLVGNDVVGRDISLGIELGYLLGNLGEQKYKSSTADLTSILPSTKPSRLDIALTLKFYKFPKYLRLTSR